MLRHRSIRAQLIIFCVHFLLICLMPTTLDAWSLSIYPAPGLAFAVALLYGARTGATVFASWGLALLLKGLSPSVAFGIAFGSGIEAVIGGYFVWLLGRRYRMFDYFSRGIGVLVASVAASAAGASLGVGVLLMFKALPTGLGSALWMHWWSGHTLSGLVYTSLFVYIVRALTTGVLFRPRVILRLAVAIGLAYAGVSLVTLSPAGGGLFFILFPLLLLTMYISGPLGMYVCAGLVSFLLVRFASQNDSVFVISDGPLRFLPLQLLLAAFGLTSLMIGGLRWLDSWARPTCALLLGWLLAGALFYILVTSETAREAERFATRVTKAQRELQKESGEFRESMKAVAALMAYAKLASPDAWQSFVQSLELDSRLPGLQSLNYVTAKNATGGTRYHWLYHYAPAGEARVAAHVEPLYFGLERAFVRARESGNWALATHGPERFDLVLPDYGPIRAPKTFDERHRRLRGFIHVAFAPAALFHSVLNRVSDEVALEVRAAAPAPDLDVIFSLPSRRSRAAIEAPFVFADLPLKMSWRRMDEVTSYRDMNLIWCGFGGAVLSLLMAVLVANLQVIHQRAKRIAKGMTSLLRERERHLQQSREQFELAVRGSNDGIYDWDIRTKEIYYSPRWKEIIGYEDHELPNRLREWLKRVHPEDRERTREAVRGYLAGGEHYFYFEHRLRQREGGYKWVLVRGVVLRDSTGQPTRLAGSISDIDERKRFEQIIIDSREEALAATKAKSQFLANMTHEIRTPLNGIIGMASLLAETRLDARQAECTAVIKDSAHSLLTVISDILDFSKIEAGKMELEVIDFDLAEILRDVTKLMEHSAREKGLELSVLCPDLPLLRGDAVRLRQIVTNLLSNAVKFTFKGRVQVRVILSSSTVANASRVTVEVEDQGIGISLEAQARIFEAFTQADPNTTRRFGGSGLGLSICKRLVSIMAGTLGVRSQEGEGSTFWFTVDLPHASAVALAQPARSELARQTRFAARVLVADDNHINQLVLSSLLERFGYGVLTVANGRDVLTALETAPYDLILMDCHMPEIDGIEATRLIRQSHSVKNPRIPIVAITADTVKENLDECLAAGMNDYLTKPVRPGLLFEKLEQILSASEVPLLEMKDDFQVALANLARVSDAQLVPRMITALLSSLPTHVERIEAALASSNLSGAKREAHGLRGAAATLGLTELARTCETLERGGDLEHAREEFVAFRALVERTETRLRAHLQSHSAV